MRKGILVAGLAIAAASISGCQSTNPDFDAGLSPASGSGTTTGGTTGGTGTGGTGTGGASTGTDTGTTSTASTSSSTFSPGDTQNSGTGDPAITTLADGDTGMAFNSVGQSADSGALVQTIPTATGMRVAVDDGTGGALDWPEPIDVPLYAAGTARGNHASNYDASDIQNHSLLKGADTSATYGEFRRIDGTADAELQLWEYNHSYIGQYRVWRGGNTPDERNLAVFHGGNKTNATNLPATATYTGRMGGTATAANWVAFDRTVEDIDATDPSQTFERDPATGEIIRAASVDPNGEWRVTADATLNADFAAGRITGRFDNTVWKKWTGASDGTADVNGYTTIYNSQEGRSPFPHRYNVNGTIRGADFAGSVTSVGGYVQGTNHASGSFYGPNGEEAAGIFYNESTAPGPTDGDSPYEQNRRGYVNTRGVFWGSQ